MSIMIAILKKQLKDTLKNKTVLIQFIMFPILTLIMNNAVKLEGMPDNFFVELFAAMYIGMAPLTSISAIISEEQEKNTLRVLMMSNVKPHEYLLGIGCYVWTACMVGSLVICIAGNYGLKMGLLFMAVMAIGILTSLLIGAAIGLLSRTQMMATSISVPVMMIFAFMPMLSMFNDTIAKIAKFTYSVQISNMLNRINALHFEADSIGIIAVNALLFIILFVIAYNKNHEF